MVLQLLHTKRIHGRMMQNLSNQSNKTVTIMKKNLLYIITASIFLASCNTNEDLLSIPETVAIEETVTVQINSQIPDISVETRSSDPLDVAIENPMYSLWLLHYSSEGALINNDTERILNQTDDQGLLSYSFSKNLTLQNNETTGTICLIANIGSSLPTNLGNTLESLRKATIDLPIQSNGLPSKMYMFGYYQGELRRSNQAINISMGRMLSRLDVILTNNTGKILQNVSVSIENASIKSHYFPTEVANDRYYSTINHDSSFNLARKTTKNCYFFTGENINPVKDKVTTLVVKVSSGTTYRIPLSGNKPDENNDNYSIYRNNFYTFNINLK